MGDSGKSTQRAWVMAAVDAHEQHLVRFATRLLRDEAAARDVVQHAFLKLCQQDREEIDRRVSQWLFTAVRHRAIDVLRRRGREQPLGEELFDSLAQTNGNPAGLYERRELGELLLSLVDTLPLAQRETVLLWLEGHSSSQIAAITQRNNSTVRVHLHKALKALREHPAVRRLMMDEDDPPKKADAKLVVSSRRDESA